MDKFKIIEKLSFIIIVLFAFFGFMNLGTIVHESSHWKDYHRIAIEGTEYTCLLQYPSNESWKIWEVRGSYTFEYPLNASEELDTLSKHTEFKAYRIETLIVSVPFFFCFFILLIERWSRKFDNL